MVFSCLLGFLFCKVARRKYLACEMDSAVLIFGNDRSVPDASRFCPNCSTQLVDQQCKLKCPQCGYYLS